MPGWNHTYSVRDAQEHVVARCCSFEGTPLKEGHRCWVHKGKLLRGWETTEAVVKVYRDLNGNSDAQEAKAEVEKFGLANSVLRQYCGRASKEIQLAGTFFSRVEKLGKGSKMKKKMGCSLGSLLEKEDSVVVQDFVQGDVRTLFRIADSPRRASVHQALLQLVNESYRSSAGSCVIGAIEGVVVPDCNGNGGTCHVTSLTIHSRSRGYGRTDQGARGVEKYEGWWRASAPLTPTAPPRNLNDAGRPRPPGGSDTVWPTPGSGPLLSGGSTAPSACRPPLSADCTDGGPAALGCVRRQTLADLLATTPQLRSYYPESLLNRVLGPVPAYSFCDPVS